jgi:hypothetical protein
MAPHIAPDESFMVLDLVTIFFLFTEKNHLNLFLLKSHFFLSRYLDVQGEQSSCATKERYQKLRQGCALLVIDSGVMSLQV